MTFLVRDVTKTRNGERGTGNEERGTGNGERESGNECTAVIRLRLFKMAQKTTFTNPDFIAMSPFAV